MKLVTLFFHRESLKLLDTYKEIHKLGICPEISTSIIFKKEIHPILYNSQLLTWSPKTFGVFFFYLLALFPTTKSAFFPLTGQILGLSSTRRTMELGNFPPLDLRESCVRGHNVQGDLRHPDGEDSFSHILRRSVLDVNFSRQSTTIFRAIHIDGCT